jgi:hypothetical protein
MRKKKTTTLTEAADSRVEECVESFRKRLVELAMYYSTEDVRNKDGGEPAKPCHVDDAHFYLLDEFVH